MDNPPPAPAGFMGTLRMFGDGFITSIEQRLELFTVELQEEKFRLIQTALWIWAAAFAGMMALTFASLALVYLFWASARLAVLGGLAVFYTGALVGIIVAFRRFLARQPVPFEATRQELTQDRACIHSKN